MATQMAAAVGQHTYNFSLEDLAYYTKPQGLEKEPKLSPDLAPALHEFISINNLHPVKLCQFLESQPCLFNEAAQIARVLDCISEDLMEGAGKPNDVLAIKLHYLARVVRGCKSGTGIKEFIKYLLKGRESDGFPMGMEKFIRDSIKEFTYDSLLMQEMVRSIAGTNPGDEPSALVILTQGINGSVDTETMCSACGGTKAVKKCSVCKMVNYCNQACQKLHWFTHKKSCKTLAEQRKKFVGAQKELEEREAKEKKEKEEKERKVKEEREQQPQQQGLDLKISDSDIIDVAYYAKLSHDQLQILFLKLGMDAAAIENAEQREVNRGFQLQSVRVLQFWLQTNGKRATRKAIVKALEDHLTEAKTILLKKWVNVSKGEYFTMASFVQSK
ncbi:ankyrin repeat and MYND domain-containing protein 2-like [Amphiura filiformis]|uniref:ankyrin repeat and MYND domain-containing protein 2-like n=1 Tax=Amphiura filiformis TaxID=82378 RepID=UPI003B215000